MANKSFSVRISLDGGADIQKQLQNIGKAGKDAFAGLEQASRGNTFLERFGTSIKEVGAKLAELKKSAGEVGASIAEFGSKVGESAERLGFLGGASIAGAVAGFIEMTKRAGEAQEQLSNTADAIGITVQQLSNLRDAANLTGISGDQFERGLIKLNTSMAAAGKSAIQYQQKVRDLQRQLATGEINFTSYTKSMKALNQTEADSLDAFNRLGISIKNADGSLRNTHDVLLDVSDALKGMSDGANKTGIITELFGVRNARMARFVGQGSKSILEMEKEAERLAPTLDKLSAENLAEAGDSFEQLHRTIDSVNQSVLALFAPQVTRVVNAFIEAIVQNRTDLVLFAATIADKVKPVVDDLVAALDGRDISKDSFINKARDAVVNFATAAQKAVNNIIIPAFKIFLGTLDLVAKAINAVFGTNLTGGELAMVAIILKLTGLFGVLTSGVKLAYIAVSALVGTFGLIPVAIAAAGFAIGVLLYNLITDWDGTTKKIKELWDSLWALLPPGAKEAFDKIMAPFYSFVEIVRRIFTGLVIIIESVFNGDFQRNLGLIFDAIWQGIKDGASALVQHVIDDFNLMAAKVSSLFGQAGDALKGAWDTVKQGATDAAQWVVDKFNAAVAFIQSIPGLITAALQAGWDAIKQGAADAAQWVETKFTDAFDSVAAYVKPWADRVMAFIQPIIDGIKKVESWLGSSGGDSSVAMAAGGHVRGPGTGTSDSIRAWLSNGEFVMPKAAVDFFGLDFMEAIRRMRDPFRGFSAGGLATGLASALTPTVPRFRDGGLVSAAALSGASGHPVELHLSDRIIRGLTASSEAVDELQRFATMSRIRSTGKAPRWKGG